MNERRGFLYLLTGLALGLGLGLGIAWGLAPTQFTDTTPSSLRRDFKDEYRYMIASAYGATGNLARAQARLGTIGDADQAKALGEQAQRMQANNSPRQVTQILADLSEALQVQAAASTSLPTSQTGLTNEPNSQTGETSATPAGGDISTATETPVAQVDVTATDSTPEPEDTATPIPSPIPTLAPLPRPTATVMAGPAFELVQQASLCEPSQPGLLQIYLTDVKGKPAAGIELVITWFGGEEHFFSGLKPEINPGYADYALSDGVEYDLSFPVSATRITGLTAPVCTDSSGKVYPGSIRLDFKQP